jgi:hypothetical protein
MKQQMFSPSLWLLVTYLSVATVAFTPVARAEEAVEAATEASPSTSSESAASTPEPEQGAGQGAGQGANQGTANGGPTLEELGIFPDENGRYDTSSLGENDPRQGAHQGSTDAPATTVEASNTHTGSDSTNSAAVDTSATADTTVTNASATTNAAAGTALTGQNSASENTGNASATTGNAGVGVQQVTADNLTTAGSYGEIEHDTSAGSHAGDYVLSFDPEVEGAALAESFRSTNSVTGSGSENTADVTGTRETRVEVQNDGTIANTLDSSAITGENTVNQNTGNATVVTGDANVAATLINFLNANVVDGALWLAVADIFGDLNGNVVIPEDVVAYLTRRQRELSLEAANDTTGSQSTNTLDVDVTDEDTTTLRNTARVQNDVAIDAVTGQNAATQNTGGSTIATGNVQATTNTVTLANMNVVDGNLGVIIVNALNKWLAFLLGADGSWTPIEHDYSTIEAENRSTGSDSTNTTNVDVTNRSTTDIQNDATVTNSLNLAAITGRNTANQNTGNASIATGDAHVNATVVNVVNTNVVRGSFFVAVVNVFGNWLGDLFFGGHSLAGLAGGGQAGVAIAAENAHTGSGSENTIDVDANSDSDVTVENTARIRNTLVVNADTGHNEANRNTGLGFVDTGDAFAALHARNVANVTVAGIGSPWANITADLLNATTGSDFTNIIDVTVNDTRQVTVLNDAQADTAIGAVANTGFNTANRNTLGGLVRTGEAGINAAVENLLNQTWLTGYEYGDDPGYSGIRFGLANTTTGSDSTNANTVQATIRTEADIRNSCGTGRETEYVENGNVCADTDATLVATTGNNEANENTGGGAVESSSAALGGGVENTVNQTAVTGGSGGSFDLDVENEGTVQTAFGGSASTGENEANKNTGSIAFPSSPAAGGASSSPEASGQTAVAGSSADGDGDSHGERTENEKGNGGTRVRGGVGGGLTPTSRVRGLAASTTSSVHATPTPRVSAVGPFGRFALGAQIVETADASSVDAPSAIAPATPSVKDDASSGLVAAAERAWPWVFVAAAIGLLSRVFLRRTPVR